MTDYKDDWEIPGLQMNNKLTKIIELLLTQQKEITEIKKNQEILLEKSQKSDLQYDGLITILQDTKTQLQNSDTKNIEELKPILQKIKLNNEKITNNLSSAFFKQRNDNLFWRSYSNNFSKTQPIFPSIFPSILPKKKNKNKN